MTTRRNLLRAAALAPVVAALPALACNADTDPAIIAIRAYKEARALWCAAEDDIELGARSGTESAAAIVALSTVPTTPAGLRAFCEFGAWLLDSGEAELGEWFPGARNAGADQRSAEEMYFSTLAAASVALLPAAPQDIGTMPVCVPSPALPVPEPLAVMIRQMERLPAQSREAVLDTLRLAVRLSDEMPGDYAAPNLARPVLAFFEART